MALHIKKGVDLFAINPVMLIALTIIDQIYMELGISATVVTSCRDGEHSPKSYHRFGLGLDIRSKNILSATSKSVVVIKFLERCPGFDLILEYVGMANEHFHLEYDPKYADG